MASLWCHGWNQIPLFSKERVSIFICISCATVFLFSHIGNYLQLLGKGIRACSSPPNTTSCHLFPNKYLLLRRTRNVSPSGAHASSVPRLECDECCSPNQNIPLSKTCFYFKWQCLPHLLHEAFYSHWSLSWPTHFFLHLQSVLNGFTLNYSPTT